MSAAKIAELNDQFRKHGVGNGRVMVTRSVRDLGPDFELGALLKVKAFDAFAADNDPHGEHDFGSFELEARRSFSSSITTTSPLSRARKTRATR
jgi:hypothetical protein